MSSEYDLVSVTLQLMRRLHVVTLVTLRRIITVYIKSVGLAKRALIKYSKINYNFTVKDVLRFVASFNEKTPEYERRLGYRTILEAAEKLHEQGQL